MRKYKKKGILAHSCTAIGIGLMAWIAGTVALTILQVMEMKTDSTRMGKED